MQQNHNIKKRSNKGGRNCNFEYNQTISKYANRFLILSTGVTILSGVILTGNITPNVLADTQSTANASIKVNEICSMTATVDSAHTATLINGVYSGDYVEDGITPYANGIGKTTIQTFCNDGNGYAIYAIGFTGGYAGIENGTNTVLHSNAHGAYDIVTGTATNGLDNGDTSNWAMKVSSKPGTHAPTITNGYDNYSNVPTSYTKVAEYANNTGTVGAGSSIETTYAAYISNTQATGTYTGQVKYALVHPSAPASGPYIMQDVANWKGSLLPGEQVIAIDNRDGKEYYVSRLDDDNVWMTQNLDHNIVAGKTYTPADTDIPANWVPSTSTYAKGVTTWNYSITSPESYDPGNLCWNGVLVEDPETTLDSGTTACDGSNMNYSIGNYYNWTAAVAMSDSRNKTGDVNQSICPAGWMLPKSGTVQTGSGSFLYLKNQLSLTSGRSGNIQNSPAYFTYGGRWEGESRYVGNSGLYWSSVVYDVGISYGLSFDEDMYLHPQSIEYTGRSFSVRCVAR